MFVLFETNTENEVCVRDRHFRWWARDRNVAREPESRCRALLLSPMAHARRHASAVTRVCATSARTMKSFRELCGAFGGNVGDDPQRGSAGNRSCVKPTAPAYLDEIATHEPTSRKQNSRIDPLKKIQWRAALYGPHALSSPDERPSSSTKSAKKHTEKGDARSRLPADRGAGSVFSSLARA